MPRAFVLLEPWRTRLLWLSLAGNLFAAGLLVPPLFRHHPAPGPPGFDRLIARMARDMPDADAEGFRRAMDHERPWYDISRQHLEESRAAIARAIGQTPFDPAALRAAMGTMQDTLRQSSNRFDDSLVLALSSLSPEARARVSASMNRRHP